MRIVIPKESQGTAFYDDAGNKLDIKATRVWIEASIDEPVRVNIDLLCIDTYSIEEASATFCVAGYNDVVGLVLKDGTKVALGEEFKLDG